MQPMSHSQDKKAWTMPVLTVHGSLANITETQVNKIGNTHDQYTGLTQGMVIGSIVPVG